MLNRPIFETEQLQIGNWVKTRQNCLVLSAVVFTPPTWTRQDKTVLSCPCRWCEQAIRLVLMAVNSRNLQCYLKYSTLQFVTKLHCKTFISE